MQTAAIETVANSLPENGLIILIFFILRGYKSYTDLHKNFEKGEVIQQKGAEGAKCLFFDANKDDCAEKDGLW